MKISASFFLIFCSILLSCKKEKISKNHSELAGTWKETNGTSTYRILDISDNSTGTLYEYYPGDNNDTKFRKFRIKNDRLFYGLSNDIGEITQFPTVATSSIPLGFGINDSITAGTKYIIVNHNYFIFI